MRQDWDVFQVKATNRLSVGSGYRLPTVLQQLFGIATFGDWNRNKYVSEGYMKNAALYSIVNRIARTAASAPFKVYKIVDRKKHLKHKMFTGKDATAASVVKAMSIKALAYEEDTEHPLNGFLENPNPWQSGSEYVFASVAFKLITGNRVILLTTLDMGANAGQVTSMVNLPPQHIAPVPDGLFGVKEYEFHMGRQIKIPAENIIHSRYFNPDINLAGDHLMGHSPLASGRKILDVSDASDLRSLHMMKKAGAAMMIFNKSVGELTVEQAAMIKRQINEDVLGLDNTGNVVVGNGDMGAIDLFRSFSDMGVELTQKYSLQQLCNIYGVPYILFGSDSSTYNNIREAKKELLTMAVLPELVSLRDDYNKIAAKFGVDVYIDFDMSVYAELQEDMQKMADVYSKAWWTTGNEKRLAMGMDEDTAVPEMGMYFIPSGLQNITNLNPDVLDEQMNRADELDGQD